MRTYVNDGEAERLGRRRAWTENISTRADRRKRGIASALIAASLRQLAERGFDEAALGADLDSPSRALDLYESLGYEVVLRQSPVHPADLTDVATTSAVGGGVGADALAPEPPTPRSAGSAGRPA